MMRMLATAVVIGSASLAGWAQSPPSHPIVLHAARVLDVAAGRMVSPGEVLVEGERIVTMGSHVDRPADAEVIDLGDRFGETAHKLREAGAVSIATYLPLYWKFPADFLQVYLLNDLPSRVYGAVDEVLEAERLWADDESLQIYRANIRWRALGDASCMPPRPAEDTYFPLDIFAPCETSA